MYSNATESTYLCAAELISLGIDQAEINRRLFSSKSAELIRAEGFAGANLKTASEGRISYLVISKSDRDALGLPQEAFETAIDVVRSLMGVEISFVVKENDKGEFKASLRATGANVAEVAALHSGGGHIRAAGCTVVAESAEAAAAILLSDLEKLIG
jgi:phosphoesterase RecJ-like protein